MKKLLTIAAIALVAGAASAVTMDWGTAAAVQFNGAKLASNSGVTGYLIALSSFADSYTVDDSFDYGKIGTKVDEKNKTSAASKIKNSWEIGTTGYSNGDTFAVLLKYETKEDGKDVTYWNLSKELVTMSGMSADPPLNAEATASEFSYGMGTDPILKANGGWVKAKPIPEPATGALALAGIALLFRRRKA